jgi:hypothetical protein
VTPTGDTVTPTPTGVRRALTDVELAGIFDAIAAATSTGDVLVATINGLYTALLADLGHTLDTLGPDQRLNPTDFAIPTSQWKAIAAAATNRADEWGTAPSISINLINAMPSSYDDPTIPDPAPQLPDRRPVIHHLRVSREATDVIGACTEHVTALGHQFGLDSDIYQRAAASWQWHLTRLFAMGSGAETSITAEGRLSLLVTTSSGLVWAVIFHRTRRVCTVAGCPAVIGDDGTVSTTPTRPVPAEHEHQPSYPLDAPTPGEWSAHS